MYARADMHMGAGKQGHHSNTRSASGFCLFNNVAVAARAIQYVRRSLLTHHALTLLMPDVCCDYVMSSHVMPCHFSWCD